jgi:undecaprenyl-diphosphatase
VDIISKIVELDIDIFLFLNNINSPFFDNIMWFISGKFSWLPLYLAVLFFLGKRYRLKSIVVIILLILVITLCDQISVHAFKEVFQRLRPCHNPNITNIHIVNDHCGGSFGFVSSHAANAFGFAVYTLLMFSKRNYSLLIILWAVIVSYSRIYLGVHFPADVIGGAIVGSAIGWLVFISHKLISRNLKNNSFI